MNSELVLQINSILRYLQENAGALSDTAIQESVLQVYELLAGNFKNDATAGEIGQMKDIADSLPVDLPAFNSCANSVLLKCCTDAIKELTNERNSLNIEMASAIDKIKGLISERNALEAEINYTAERIERHRNSRQLIAIEYMMKYNGFSDQFGGKGVVYCAITGGYDEIPEPEVKDPKLDYVLFTDNPPENYQGLWQIRKLENPLGLSLPRLARWAKMHPFDLFPEYDWSIWIDGKLQILSNLTEYVGLYKKKCGMLCFPHYDCPSLQDGMEAIIYNKKADPEILQKQFDTYKAAGYPLNSFIVETGCIVRNHHDKKLKKVMDDWWNELISYDHNRDQMSFNYACWKNGYDYDICNLEIFDNMWMRSVAVHLE